MEKSLCTREVILNTVFGKMIWNGAKHSPRRFRLGGPEGPFRHFQRKKVIFRFFEHLWRQKCHSQGSQQNTSPLNILVLPENNFIASKNRKIV